jgi:hypothetical protein
MAIVIDVVCPSCGKLTKANILEKAGTTSTKCPFCDVYIYIFLLTMKGKFIK